MKSKSGLGRRLRGWLPVILSFLILVGATVTFSDGDTLRQKLRNITFDTYQQLKPRPYRTGDQLPAPGQPPAPVPVRIVDIDDDSLAKIGQWPWPRTRIAELIDRLREAGAAVIAFDVVFSEPDRTSPAELAKLWPAIPEVDALIARLPDHDTILADAIGQAPVVTSFTVGSTPSPPTEWPAAKARFVTRGDPPEPFLTAHPGTVHTLPQLEAKASGNGAFSFEGGLDGIVRDVPLLIMVGERDPGQPCPQPRCAIYPTLAAEALRVAIGTQNIGLVVSQTSGGASFGTHLGLSQMRIGPFKIDTDEHGKVYLYYGRPEVKERYVSAADVLASAVDRSRLEGSIVFIGTSARALQDLRYSPLGGFIPGVEMHAQIVEAVFQDKLLLRPGYANAVEIMFLIGFSVLVIVLIARLGAVWSAVTGLLSIGLAIAAAWYAFAEWRLLFEPLYPSLTIAAIFLVCSITRQVQSEYEGRWIREAFSAYVSPNLVQHLINNPEQLKLGGERRECTFVMTDLAGFTSLVERSDPASLVSLLNDYLDAMIGIAFKHEGTLDKIVGDAVPVIFSAPVTQPDHHARAVACALEMDAFAQGFSREKNEAGIPLGRTRIGVHSGSVIVGNVGGKSSMDYRPLGDAINTAARLEGLNKHLGTRVCISGETASRVPGFIGRPAGIFYLKGKTTGLEVFEPLTAEEDKSAHIASYRAAYRALAEKSPDALGAFERHAEHYPDDPLAAFHIERLKTGEFGIDVVMAEK